MKVKLYLAYLCIFVWVKKYLCIINECQLKNVLSDRGFNKSILLYSYTIMYKY